VFLKNNGFQYGRYSTALYLDGSGQVAPREGGGVVVVEGHGHQAMDIE